jgi:cation transport ATPase
MKDKGKAQVSLIRDEEKTMKIQKKVFVPVAVLVGLLFLVDSAHAYLDPGTGSMLVQGVLATIAAVFVSVKVFHRRIASYFGRFFSRKRDREHDH